MILYAIAFFLFLLVLANEEARTLLGMVISSLRMKGTRKSYATRGVSPSIGKYHKAWRPQQGSAIS